MNKPCLSINDILNNNTIIKANNSNYIGISGNELKELVKNKLNK